MLIKFNIAQPKKNIEQKCFEVFFSVDKATNIFLEIFHRIPAIANRSQDFCEGIFDGGGKIVFKTIRHLYCRNKIAGTNIGTMSNKDVDIFIIDVLKLLNSEIASIFQQIMFHESTSPINCVSAVFQDNEVIDINRQRSFVVGYLLMNEIISSRRLINVCEELKYVSNNTART